MKFPGFAQCWWAQAAPVSSEITRQCGNDWAVIWVNTIQALKAGDFFFRVWHSNRSLQNLFFQAVKTHCICSISYWNLTKKPKIRFPFPGNKAIPSRLELGMDFFIYVWQFLLNNGMFFGVLCADVWEYVRQNSSSLCVWYQTAVIGLKLEPQHGLVVKTGIKELRAAQGYQIVGKAIALSQCNKVIMSSVWKWGAVCLNILAACLYQELHCPLLCWSHHLHIQSMFDICHLQLEMLSSI